jgi:hypothetical protein
MILSLARRYKMVHTQFGTERTVPFPMLPGDPGAGLIEKLLYKKKREQTKNSN